MGQRSEGRPTPDGREGGQVPGPDGALPDLLRRTAQGDEDAFATLYDLMAPRVYGLARRIVRDPAHAEEVAQEVLVEVWRTASRFDASRGSAVTWILTLTHRRTVDRVRSTQSAVERDRRAAAGAATVAYDEVAEQVTTRLEQRAVRRCLRTLTALQREVILIAYYQGHTYRQVAELLEVPLPTVKTRMRDGLIRLRDCLGVSR